MTSSQQTHLRRLHPFLIFIHVSPMGSDLGSNLLVGCRWWLSRCRTAVVLAYRLVATSEILPALKFQPHLESPHQPPVKFRYSVRLLMQSDLRIQPRWPNRMYLDGFFEARLRKIIVLEDDLAGKRWPSRWFCRDERRREKEGKVFTFQLHRGGVVGWD